MGNRSIFHFEQNYGEAHQLRLAFELCLWQSGQSGRPIIAMMQPAESHERNHATESRGRSSPGRCFLPKSQVCPVLVVVGNVFAEREEILIIGFCLCGEFFR